MKLVFLPIFMTISLYVNSIFAASYNTLPAGVNMIVFKQVMTSKIESKFDSNNQNDSLSLQENFNSAKLENINSALKTYFKELKAISPDAYNQFSLGEFKAEANAQVSAQGLALARGITDHLTLYGSIPFYHIKTNVTFYQTKGSNLPATQAAVQNAATPTPVSAFVRQLTLQLPETNEQLLQSLIVNYYGYKPLGAWEKDALGDAEVGGIFRLTDFNNGGIAIAMGAVLPTGDPDDPDSLQDVATGDGQYDAFVESMAGISFFDNALEFDLKGRYTYQFASTKVLRAIDDPNLSISRTKEKMREKLGNKIDSTFTVTYNTTSWLNFNSSFIYNETGSTTVGASDPNVKSAIEYNSNSINQWARLGVGLSSVELYKQKKIDIPCELNLSAQRLLNAKNSANYDRFDLDFKLFF